MRRLSQVLRCRPRGARCHPNEYRHVAPIEGVDRHRSGSPCGDTVTADLATQKALYGVPIGADRDPSIGEEAATIKALLAGKTGVRNSCRLEVGQQAEKAKQLICRVIPEFEITFWIGKEYSNSPVRTVAE